MTHSEKVSQGLRCAGLRADNTSGLKGVSRYRGWSAEIRVNGRLVHLGSFADRAKAGRAYDKAARYYFGRDCKTNRDLGLLP